MGRDFVGLAAHTLPLPYFQSRKIRPESVIRARRQSKFKMRKSKITILP
jgi:hypothetical protein